MRPTSVFFYVKRLHTIQGTYTYAIFLGTAFVKNEMSTDGSGVRPRIFRESLGRSADPVGWKSLTVALRVLQMPEAAVKKATKSAAKVKTEKVVESADKAKKVVKQKRQQKRPYGRLYARAVFTGFRRGLRNQHENVALLKVDGCDSKSDSWFYVGKRVAYVYRVRIALFLID